MVRIAVAACVVLLAPGAALAQLPMGAIAGTVFDTSRATVSEAAIVIVNLDTGATRAVVTNTDGAFAAGALPPGPYRVMIEAPGFKRLEREVRVEAGTTTTIDSVLELGEVRETVVVKAAAPALRRDHHQISGVVSRDEIEQQPLNGRNFLELAKTQPGVTNPSRAAFGRTFVPSLGGGLNTVPRVGYTHVTLDGSSINSLGAVGTNMQISPDVIQEFQMSTVNFDPSTGRTAVAALNIVTRSGGNTTRGSVFSFYRDHRLAAYPGLSRDPDDPAPFFQRHQYGGWLGGPLRTDRAFYFASYERHDQRGLVAVRPDEETFALFRGLYSSPSHAHLFSARGDVRLGPRHQAFVRHTGDISRSYTGGGLPSSWALATARVYQTVAALTSVLSPRATHDVRMSYFPVVQRQQPRTAAECASCFGLGPPRVSVDGTGLVIGDAPDMFNGGGRYHLSATVIWHRGAHALRLGFEWDHTRSTASTLAADTIVVWSPAEARRFSIATPSTFATRADVLRLPLRSFETTVGPATTLQRHFGSHRVVDGIRLYAADTWRVRPRLTVNGGLGWSYEPNALNDDLVKPGWFLPLVGAAGLRAPRPSGTDFSPTVGFNWTASRNGRTVVRGGAGRYFDPVSSTNVTNLTNERAFLLPLGTGRLTGTQSNTVHPDGRSLEFLQPTTFTGSELLAVLPAIRAQLEGQLAPGNRDFRVRNIDALKTARNLYDASYATPYGIHVNLGVQQELPRGIVVSADGVWRRFVHNYINGIDYNRWNSASGPVIRPCAAAELGNVDVVCSSGPIRFDTTIGRARYVGLLVRVERRSTAARFLVSYALSSYTGTNGTGLATAEATGGRVFGFNNDNWFENIGPLPSDQRHVLNASASLDLPLRLQTAFSVSAYSRPPFSAYIGVPDLNCDGTVNDLLPGSTINAFGRSLDKSDLVRLVSDYNAHGAGRRTVCGQLVRGIPDLPATYEFDDTFFTVDVRLTRTLALGRQRLLMLAEAFNLLNTANLVQYGGNLLTSQFGQPGARFTQIFGSGGPRAFQLGARVSF